MGWGTNWDSNSWASFKTTHNINKNSTSKQLFNQGTAKNDMLTYKCNRESRDSVAHPNSGSIILGLDTTGSMSHVLQICFLGLDKAITEIFKRINKFEPQIMVAAIDDYASTKWAGVDKCPALQWTQFEVDIKIAEQMHQLKETGHGSGNGYESYPLLWYAASRHTEIDCYEKRGMKGVLITMGDDGLQGVIHAEEIKAVFGDEDAKDISVKDLYREVSKKYEVYHLMLTEGSSHDRHVESCWRDVLGERALLVSDIAKLPEIIISVIQAATGQNINNIVNSWDGSTQLAVKKALEGLSTQKEKSSGLIRF